MDIEISRALLRAQTEMGSVVKDADNPYYKSRYASLEAVLDTVLPVFNKNGLGVLQLPCPSTTEETLAIRTVIFHGETGQTVESVIELPIASHDPQKAGAAISYAKRYALAAVACLKTADDDAESAMPFDRGDAKAPSKKAYKGKSAKPALAKRASKGKSAKLAPEAGESSDKPKTPATSGNKGRILKGATPAGKTGDKRPTKTKTVDKSAYPKPDGEEKESVFNRKD